jgi:hypothetical protein
MKYLHFIGLLLCAASLVSCETTQTAGHGNQEQKRLAAIQQEQQEAAQIDEAEGNLWSAQQNRINRQSNPTVDPVRP